MKKQKNSLQYGGEINSTTIVKITVCLYAIIYFKGLYLLSQYVQNIQAIIIQGINSESLCKSPYENETLRYALFMYTKNSKESLSKLKKTYVPYYTSLIILTSLILIANVLIFFCKINYNSFSDIHLSSSFILPIICIIILSGNQYVINSRLPLLNDIESIKDYTKNISLLKETIFTPANLGQISKSYTITEIAAYISKDATTNATHTVQIANANSATPEQINEAVFAAADPAQVNAAAAACFSPDASRETIETSINAITGKTSANEDLLNAAVEKCKLVGINVINPSLVELEKNILRRILHTSRTSNIVTTDDALAYYNTLRQTDNGINEIIGYIDFTKNSEDYILIHTAITGVSPLIASTVEPSPSKVQSSTSSSSLTVLDLGLQKSAVLLALEKLSAISYDNPKDDIEKYINSGNTLGDWKVVSIILIIIASIINSLNLFVKFCGEIKYGLEIIILASVALALILILAKCKITHWILFTYICSLYIFFHFLYTVYGAKSVIIIYFTLLICGAIFISYTSRI